MVVSLQGGGNVGVTLYPNYLFGPQTGTTPNLPPGYSQWTLPGGFTPSTPGTGFGAALPAANDMEASLNFTATRTFFEFRENDGFGFTLSNLVLHVKKSIWNAAP